MLAAITDQLREALDARGVPVTAIPVVYGPESLGQTTLAQSHIVIERSRSMGDTWGPGHAPMRNPRQIFSVQVGAVCRIFARSSLSGARTQDHERVADQLAGQVMVALREIVVARKTIWRVMSSRLLTRDDMAERNMQTWAGVVYEILFSVDRGVLDTDYAGEAATEATAGGATGFGVSTTLDTSDSPGVGKDLPSGTTRVSNG